MTNDVFAGGIQCAADRILRINAMDIDQINAVLASEDLQASVRKHAEDRLCRLIVAAEIQRAFLRRAAGKRGRRAR